MEPDEITAEVARQLTRRRKALGLSLAEVAKRCGVSLQQVHRYETAANVISAPMLWRLSRCLGVPVSYFFETVDDDVPAAE
jgi:transcriptional regulator with XRE-family HTH domain